jgi:hypothetical protein
VQLRSEGADADADAVYRNIGCRQRRDDASDPE